jgi:hypothetical protein
MADAFEDVEKQWETASRRAEALAFVKQVDEAKTPEQKAEVGRLRQQPFFKTIYDFMTYYDLKKREGSLTTEQETTLKSMEGWQRAIPMKWAEGVVAAMKRGGRRRKGLSRRKINGGRRRKTARRYS